MLCHLLSYTCQSTTTCYIHTPYTVPLIFPPACPCVCAAAPLPPSSSSSPPPAHAPEIIAPLTLAFSPRPSHTIPAPPLSSPLPPKRIGYLVLLHLSLGSFCISGRLIPSFIALSAWLNASVALSSQLARLTRQRFGPLISTTHYGMCLEHLIGNRYLR